MYGGLLHDEIDVAAESPFSVYLFVANSTIFQCENAAPSIPAPSHLWIDQVIFVRVRAPFPWLSKVARRHFSGSPVNKSRQSRLDEESLPDQFHGACKQPFCNDQLASIGAGRS
jgi:hypothetical protein